MPKLTPVHWKKFERFLFYVGCNFVREKGDHRVYWRDGLNRPIIVPRDTQLPVFIIRNNLRTLGLSVEDYLEVLKRL